MGRFLFCSTKTAHLRACHFNQQTGEIQMNSTVKSYIYFLAFMALTKMVVKPVATQMNLPIIKDLV